MSTQKRPLIVYVDDDADNLLVTQADLEEHFEVKCFESAFQALAEIKALQPVIVLSDLKMPKMNGVDFLEMVQQIYPQAKRVIITGNSDESSVIAAIKRASICDFLKKPFKDNELEKAMLHVYAEYLKEDPNKVDSSPSFAHVDLMQHPSWIYKIAHQLQAAFAKLPQYHPSARQIEEWSTFIHLAMSAEKRFYHNTHHLFDIWTVDDPYEILAILFHDVVYAQVDKVSGKGILPQIIEILGPLVPDVELKLLLPSLESLPDVQEYTILYQVFGVQAGDTLNTMTGMNEFLSARVAQRSLGSTLSPWEMIQILGCIELTIPFRGKDSQGKSAADRLLERLEILNRELPLHLEFKELKKGAERAVDMANRDVWSFAADDSGVFLNGSWQLVLEGNAPLQKVLYTPKEYRMALEKMEGFFNVLKPEMIFQRLGDFPSDFDYTSLLNRAQSNLNTGRTYFQAKILAMAIFEVISDLSGGSAPVEIFRGDIGSETNPDSQMLDQYLDISLPMVSTSELDANVLDLLKDKTTTKIRYDVKNSPLACYIYSRLKKHEFNLLVKTAKLYFKKEIEDFSLLKTFPKTLILSVLAAVSQISESRKVEILQIKKVLESF